MKKVKIVCIMCFFIFLCNIAQAQLFESPVFYDVGEWPDCITSAELNGDGYNDLVVTNRGSHNISVFFNNGDGTFQDTINYISEGSPISVIAIDLDGDNDNDLAVANYTSDEISIYLNDGYGNFLLSSTEPVPHHHRC